jgi:hypothetical protein
VGVAHHLAYETAKLDAARVELASDVTPTRGIRSSPGSQIESARYVTGDDLGGTVASIRLPSDDFELRDVTIRHVHVSGGFPFYENGLIYYPELLILADPLGGPGDSGSLLTGSDGAAIGIFTGLVAAPNQQSYAAFTELAPALDVLVPGWSE